MTDHTATDTPPLLPAVGARLEPGVRPLAGRLRECADEVMAFPHPSQCDHLHVAHHVLREAADELQQLARDNMTLFAEINELKGLLQEALEISDNWPGIAYPADLIARCKKAMPGWVLEYE